MRNWGEACEQQKKTLTLEHLEAENPESVEKTTTNKQELLFYCIFAQQISKNIMFYMKQHVKLNDFV